jgi:hypothetical protein
VNNAGKGISMASGNWGETLRSARWEYRTQVTVLVVAVVVLLACIPWGWFLWHTGWAGIGYLALGWFTSLVAFELTRIQGRPTERRFGIALVCCLFGGAILWGYLNEPASLSFFGLLTGTFVVQAERWRRNKKMAYQQLSGWNRSSGNGQ